MQLVADPSLLAPPWIGQHTADIERDRVQRYVVKAAMEVATLYSTNGNTIISLLHHLATRIVVRRLAHLVEPSTTEVIDSDCDMNHDDFRYERSCARRYHSTHSYHYWHFVPSRNLAFIERDVKMSQLVKYRNLCDRLMTALGLETVPVAVQFSSKPPENVAKLDGDSKACSMLDIARLDGRIFYTDKANHSCMNGSHYLGMTKAFRGLQTGDWYTGKYPDKGRSMYPSPVVARRSNVHYITVEPETVDVVSYAPLNNCPFDPKLGGMVVALMCTPKQALYLARSATYHMGGAVHGITGPTTCSVILAAPYVKGEMFTTHGCYGGRLFTKVKTEEEFVGFPIEMLENVVDALERILSDRPDLKRMLAEPVGTFHSATAQEIKDQIASGPFGQ